MAPSVRVPVLSVNRISTLPRSSIVTSRFTSTRLRASAREPVDRLTDTIAGSSCGVMPIAMASEKSRVSSSGRENATLTTKMKTVSTPATRARKPENSRRPTWKAVCASRSDRPAEMCPNELAMPVATTTPRPAPSCTTVPM